MATIIRSQDVIKKNPSKGADGTILHGETLSLATWRFAAGTVLPAHSHPHEQLTHVIEGTLKLTIAGTSHTLQSGDSAVIPGDVEHEAEAVTDALVVDAFHPARDDLR